MTGPGFERGTSCPCLYFNNAKNIRVLCHGDDFAVLSDEQGLDAFEAVLASRYEYKVTATLGFEEKDDKQATFLNRIITLHPGQRHSLTVEPDGRHALLLIKELGLDNAKEVDTPAEKRSAEKQLEDSQAALLDKDGAKMYRSGTMRAAS